MFALSCSEPVILGDDCVSANEVGLCELSTDFASFADDTVTVCGVLIDSDGMRLANSDCSLLIIPVGYSIPDSVVGGKALCSGIVFYHEDRGEPGLAVLAIKVRVDR